MDHIRFYEPNGNELKMDVLTRKTKTYTIQYNLHWAYGKNMGGMLISGIYTNDKADCDALV